MSTIPGPFAWLSGEDGVVRRGYTFRHGDDVVETFADEPESLARMTVWKAKRETEGRRAARWCDEATAESHNITVRWGPCSV